MWNVLKQLARRDKDIVDLGAETEKLANKAQPAGQQATATRQATEAFIHSLETKLTLALQK